MTQSMPSPPGVPCAPVNNMQQVFANRQVRHRGLQVTLQHPRYGEVPSLGPAARYSQFDITRGWTAPPQLGEHTGEVLGDWLGQAAARPTSGRG